MELRKFNESLSVSPQITLADIPWLAANGYRTLISNRPDGEDPGQPTAADTAKASGANGISFVHIPVVSGSISDDDVLNRGNAPKLLLSGGLTGVLSGFFALSYIRPIPGPR